MSGPWEKYSDQSGPWQNYASEQPQTNAVEQGLSGFYEGFAGAAGAPVDLATAGLNLIPGVDIQDPFGGSASIERGLNVLVPGGDAISEVAPQTAGQRIARGGGRVLGETTVMAPAFFAAAPKAAATGTGALAAGKEVLRQGRKEAVEAPGRTAAIEGTAAVAAGSAGGAVEEYFPDSLTARVLAETLAAAGVGGTIARLGASRPDAPLSRDDMKRQASILYEDQVKNGLSAQPEMTGAIYSDSMSFLDQRGFVLPDEGVDPDMPKTRAVMSLLKRYAENGMTGANILRMRQAITSRMNDKNTSDTDKMALSRILQIYDGQTSDLSPNIAIANELWHRAAKSETVEQTLEVALHGGKNIADEQAIRTAFRPLMKRIIQGTEPGWTQAEREEIIRLVEGGSAVNFYTWLGKFAPTSGLTTTAGGAGGGFLLSQMTGMSPAASIGIGAGVGGTAALSRMNASRLQRNLARELEENVRRGGPTPVRTPPYAVAPVIASRPLGLLYDEDQE
jgi:hypothetical protein